VLFRSTILGGDGTDEADYGGEVAAVVVSADGVAGDGPAGENDNVGADVEAIDGGSGDDTLTAAAGPGLVFGGAGDDRLTGGAGDDQLFGQTGDDALAGGPGRDRLNGNSGADALDGGEGDDVLRGSAGGTDGEPDMLEGGPGSDTADFSDSGLPLAVTLDGVANDGPVAEGDNVLAENVLTGFGDDSVVGTAGRNIIATGAGNDVIDVSGDGQEVDDVVCGSGFDEATVDARDAVATTGEQSRCETVNGLPATSSPAAIQNPVTIRDRRAARIAVSLARCPKRLRGFRRGCRIRVVGDEAIRVHARMSASFKRVRVSAGSGLVLSERDTRMSGPDGVRHLRLKPARRPLRRAPRRFRVRVLIEAFDGGGNRTAVTRSVTIRR
jgi:Ca2+-binding RTX toxin-like protein